MKTIGFPGLGWEFHINSTAFTIFGLDIQWYGIIISVGIVLSFLLFYRLATKKESIPGDTVFNVTLLTVPVAIIGARLVYVLTRLDYYSQKSFWDIINIRGGGLAIYGAIIFGLATVLLFNKIKKTSALSMLDALAPAVMLGQIIGRWGNFMNGEAYGWTSNVEQFPWRMWLETVKVDGVKIDSHLVHPTFLYESLWNLIGLVIILAVLYRRKKFNGEIFCAYMGWYGFGRFFIEMIRADSLYIVGNLKFSVFTGAVCFIAAIICAIIFKKRAENEDEALIDYKSGFKTITLSGVDGESDGDEVDGKAEDSEESGVRPDGGAEPDVESGDPDAELQNDGNSPAASEQTEEGGGAE